MNAPKPWAVKVSPYVRLTFSVDPDRRICLACDVADGTTDETGAQIWRQWNDAGNPGIADTAIRTLALMALEAIRLHAGADVPPWVWRQEWTP